jgi:hypothetical protein
MRHLPFGIPADIENRELFYEKCIKKFVARTNRIDRDFPVRLLASRAYNPNILA